MADFDEPEWIKRSFNEPAAEPRQLRVVKPDEAAPDGFELQNFARDVELKPISWMVSGYIPFGAYVNIQGMPDQGKTTAVSEIVGCVTRGESVPWDPSPGPREPMNVLWVTIEEDPALHIGPRLERNGVVMERVDHLRWDPKRPSSLLTFPSRADAFEAMVRRERANGKPIGLLVVDGLVTLLDPELNYNSEQHVRPAMGVLSATLARLDLACIAIRHQNKRGEGAAINLGSGSIAFSGMAKAEYVVGPDPADPNRRIMAYVKGNLAQRPRSIRFELVERESSVGKGGAFQFVELCDVTAREVNEAASSRKSKKATKAERNAAADAIFDELYKVRGTWVDDEGLLAGLAKGLGITRGAYIEGKQLLFDEGVFERDRDLGKWRVRVKEFAERRKPEQQPLRVSGADRRIAEKDEN